MRGATPTSDAAIRLKQYGLVKLLGWDGYQECPAALADDFSAIQAEEARQQAQKGDEMKREMEKQTRGRKP